MEEENNNKRLMLAAGLCFLVLVVWQTLFMPQRPQAPSGSTAATQDTKTATAAATAEVVAAPARTASIAAPARVVEPKSFRFEGSVPGDGEGAEIPFRAVISNVGGVIADFELPSYKERDRDNRKTDQNISLARPVPQAGSPFGQMAALEFAEGTTFALPPMPVYEVVEEKEDSVRYRYTTPEGVEIDREYHFSKDSFQVEMAVTVRNRSTEVQTERLQLSAALPVSDAALAGDGFLAKLVPPPDHVSALCHVDGDVSRAPYAQLEAKSEKHEQNVRWVAIDRQYFVSAIVPRDGTDVDCALAAQDRIVRASLLLPAATLKPGEERRHKFTAYLGVKKPAFLTRVNAELEDAIDYTILGMNLAFLCAGLLWVLTFFHGLFNSWGLAILGLTVLVKLILFPLNQRSGRATRALTALKPQMDAIKERFPDDRQRQSEEMMKLYREHNVNPAGGCLPMLIQMPIWFALYRSLWVSTDLYQESFLWIPDLTARDPMWVLPVLLVVVMFVQQKMTPTSFDPAQQKIMQYTMPLMFGAMMMALPAGLCFYILVNTVLTILQQHFINRSIGPISGPASVQGATA